MKKIPTVLVLLIVFGFISTFVGGVGPVFGNPGGVTVNFEGATDAENYIASKANLVVSGGQVKLVEYLSSEVGYCSDGIDNDGDGYTDADDCDCATWDCVCSGSGYETHTCQGDTVYVDCNYDYCWSPTAGKYNRSQAISYCDNLNLGGKNDWFLPSRARLVDLCNSDSCSGTCFGGDGYGSYPSGIYWSSSSSGWDVYFWDCSSHSALSTFSIWVRCAHNR